ncbi:MAG: Maf-like protein [uncultured bacterium]|nr:MAG: Maf-like protein [uncultured bacterium]
MKIVICASMSAIKSIIAIKGDLERVGHEVVAPENLEKHLAKTFSSSESTEEKIKDDLIRRYFKKIKNSDAVLIINEDKKGITNYIGGNTFLEMGFAYALDRKIFLLNPIPGVSYKDEIKAMQPIVLDGDLNKII